MGQGLALQLGVHWTRSKGLSGGPGPQPTYSYYVDSVAGDDANPGTEALPFKTMSAITWTDDMTVGVKYGSYFREQVDIGARNNVQLNAYGDPVDKLPVFDCADIFVGTWINDTGNIWYADITTEDDQYTMFNSLWKDGVRMEWFASTGALTTNNDYYVAEAPAINTTVARFYIYSDVDPNTSGAVYEYASRWFGVAIGSNSFMRYLRTKRNLHNNGSASIGEQSQAQNCIFEDGVKHNVYVGKNASAFQCIGYKHDTPKRTNSTLFVGHTSDGTGGIVAFNNCIAMAEPTKTAWANANGAGVDGFYSHTAGDSGKWDEVQISDCSAIDCNQAFSSLNTTQMSINRAWANDCYIPVSAKCDTLFSQDLKITDNTHAVRRGLWMQNINNAVIQRTRMYLTRPTNNGFVYDTSPSGLCIIQNSVLMLADAAPAGFNFFFRFTNAGRGVQLQNNIVYAYDRDCNGISIPNTAANMWTPENYWGGTDNYDYSIGGVTTNNFPAALANPNYGYLFTDNINVDFGPSCVTDAPNGDFSTVAGSDAATLNAGIGPTDTVTYTAIPTYAEVDAM